MQQDAAIRKFRAFLEAEGETLGRLLAWAERRVLEATLARLAACGDDLTLAQVSLLQQLCLGRSRLSELARRTGTTKQAVGQVVDGLERKGLVRRSVDPEDSRANVIGYTAEGYAVVGRLIDATLEAEREIARRIGGDDLATLKTILGRMTDERR